jgi:endonuclease/exonuclease/phosphatase (EEP) superfamily protein YafD
MVTRTSGLATGTKTLLGMVLLTIGFLATLATVLGFFGGAWWAFDAAANFRFQLGLILVVVGVLYWITVAKGAAILFLVAGIANLALVLPLYVGSQAPAASEERLDVVSFNVEREVAARPEILQWLRSLDADFIFLQETTEEWVTALDENGIGMEILAIPPTEALHGTIVLSRTGEATASVYEVGDANDWIVEVSSSLAGRQITLLAVNPRPGNNQSDAEARDELLAEVGDIAAGRTEPVVVVGDLNATRWSYAFRDMRDRGGLKDSEDGFGFQGTWPASSIPFVGSLIALPVDHVLTTRSLTTTERSLGPEMGSDHLPLLVELAIAGT